MVDLNNKIKYVYGMVKIMDKKEGGGGGGIKHGGVHILETDRFGNFSIKGGTDGQADNLQGSYTLIPKCR